MTVAGVLFDKDGTLISFEDTWGPATLAVMRSLARGDAGLLRAQAELLHFSLEHERFLPTSPLIAGSSQSYGRLWAEALGRTDLAALKLEIDLLTAVESLKSLTPIGRPLEALAALEAMGLRLGLATNDSEASARRQIDALGLTGKIEFVAGYDSGHGSKPDPGMILAFARHLDVEPSRIAMVGDTVHDLDCARAAGAVAVAVLSGPAGREVLEPHADHVVEDIAALPALFSRLLRTDEDRRHKQIENR
jgi:phosphoglycolate phosphatase